MRKVTQKGLNEILRKHALWLDGDPEGERANLGAADLRWADLSGVDLSGADLRGANLRWANLRWANLSGANLSRADLSGANLSGANLRWANLRWANLSGANLRWADGILSTVNFLESYFERTEDGYIAYKTFNSQYRAPSTWKIEKGSIIEENVNFNRCEDCGCGINVAPLDWIKKNYAGDIWRVLIRWEWLCGVCVPCMSDGKIRCERVELLEMVESDEQGGGRTMRKVTQELEYGDLVNIVEHEKHITTRFDMVSYLIGFKGVVTAKDWGNICALYADGYIE